METGSKLDRGGAKDGVNRHAGVVKDTDMVRVGEFSDAPSKGVNQGGKLGGITGEGHGIEPVWLGGV